PARCSRSARFTPAATTSISTSPGPATASGTSAQVSTSGPPYDGKVTANMPAILLDPHVCHTLVPRSSPLPTVRSGTLVPPANAYARAWRARLVADGGGLENRFGFTPDVGSNPTPSAKDLRRNAALPAAPQRPASHSTGSARTPFTFDRGDRPSASWPTRSCRW